MRSSGWPILLLSFGALACTPSTIRSSAGLGADADADADADRDSGGRADGSLPGREVPQPNPEAFFADDPPAEYCGPAGGGGEAPQPPGGTPDCPDDKNREGCPCDTVGEQGLCWPGLRVNRDRGICHDGTTVCEPFNEFYGAWGPCEDYVLPADGVEMGPQACRCFSEGLWDIDNLSPCFYVGQNGTYAVSSYAGAGGRATCPAPPNAGPPQPQPGQDWSTNRLTVDCAGQFELCYTLRAGDGENPSDRDCIVASVCTEAWYSQAGVEQELPALPGWAGDGADCAGRFVSGGGYGEMSVLGLSVECDEISVQGEPYVFSRVRYCALDCADRPNAADCVGCGQAGSGSF